MTRLQHYKVGALSRTLPYSRASDTFLLCVNEAVSETACREDSEVMFHVSHFADKILRHHKWSCDQAGASSNRPRLESKSLRSPAFCDILTYNVSDVFCILIRQIFVKKWMPADLETLQVSIM